MLEASYGFLLIIGLIVLGYTAKRFNILKKSDGDAIARLVFNFTLPALVVSVFSKVDIEPSHAIYPALGIAIGALMFVVSLVVFRKHPGKERGILTMPLLGLNVGLFAVPLVQVIWGEEAVKYLLLLDLGNAFVIFGLCYVVAAFYANDKEEVKLKYIAGKAMRSIPLIAYILTIVLKLSGVYYPAFVVDLAEIITKANTPLAMLALGVFMSFTFDKKQVRNIFKFWAVKYIIGILAGLAVFFFAPVGEAQRAVIMMAFILPSSFSVIAYSVEFDYDTKFAGALVNSSIVISIPLMWVIALVTG